MAKITKASGLIVALTAGLLAVTAAKADETRHPENVTEQGGGIEAHVPGQIERDHAEQLQDVTAPESSVGRHGKSTAGRRHRPLGSGARSRSAQSRPREGQGHRDGSRFWTFIYVPGGTYVARLSDGSSAFGGHTSGGASTSSGFATSFSGSSGGGFAGSSGGGSSRSSGSAPSPEVNALLGFVIVAGTLAYIKRRRGSETVADAAAA